MKQKIDTVIIVLGSPNDDSGLLLDIAKSRCKQAYETYKQLGVETNCFVLPTGGFGEHFNRTNKPHAYYTKQYMIELGIPETSFLEAALSSHTVEDAVFTHNILKEYVVDTCYVVTSDFHVERARFVFEFVYKSSADIISNIIMVPATVMMPQKEKDRLIAHETKALAGLKKNGIVYEGL